MTTNLTQRVDRFATELLVRQLGGPLLLDQTFMLPFSDPLVQAALTSAQQLLASQGATGFIGPTLLANTASLTGSNTLTGVLQTAPARMFVSSSGFIGPGTIQSGVIGQCQGLNALTGVPFGCDPNAGNQLTILPGTGNTNLNIHTLYSLGVTNTTTNTFLTTQVYELDGTRGPASVPEPGTLAPMGLAMAGLWGLLIRRRKALDAP